MRNDGLRIARWIALLLPLALVGGAHLSEFFGLVPCEMCWWQRWPHYAAILVALSAFFVRNGPAQRTIVLLAASIQHSPETLRLFAAAADEWFQVELLPAAAQQPAYASEEVRLIRLTPRA